MRDAPRELSAVPAAPAAATAAHRRITAVPWCIGASLAVYLLQRTVVTPSVLRQMFGVDAQMVGHHWWSVLTYPFIHAGFWGLALNLSLFGWFAPKVEAEWGTRAFVQFAVVCAIGGWMAQVLFVPAGTVLIGGSSVVLGVLLASATLRPHDEVTLFGAWPVKTRWFALALAVLTAASGRLTDAGGASMAPVGGFVAAWWYLGTLLSMTRGRGRAMVRPTHGLPADAWSRVERPSPRVARAEELPAVSEGVASGVMRAEASAEASGDASAEAIATATLNRILDKISASGLTSLSSEERAMLDAASRRLREP